MSRGAAPTDFLRTPYGEPHRPRSRAIAAAHPEVRALFGPERRSFAIVVGLVALQVGLAWALRGAPWWGVVVAAFGVGAFANHALFVMIHECSHNLVWKRKSANWWTAILANLPIAIPSSISFIKYHLNHHMFQGDYDRDADIPARWEARLLGGSAPGKAIWLLLFPVFQSVRTMRFGRGGEPGIAFWDRWVVANLVVQVAFDALVVALLGWQAMAYLLASAFFSVGLHPVGGRWIQEHYLVHPPQETYSYYGPLNALAFNVGFHNEHHDFPHVAWPRLPRVKAMAPEFYDSLVSHRSWGALVLKFVFDPRLGLFSRAVRVTREVKGVPVPGEVTGIPGDRGQSQATVSR
ncbi:fatty acid desaturase [Myxococcota bacterium]|nr:fatty acid desaturase [Myxococcota bacterium]